MLHLYPVIGGCCSRALIGEKTSFQRLFDLSRNFFFTLRFQLGFRPNSRSRQFLAQLGRKCYRLRRGAPVFAFGEHARLEMHLVLNSPAHTGRNRRLGDRDRDE